MIISTCHVMATAEYLMTLAQGLLLVIRIQEQWHQSCDRSATFAKPQLATPSPKLHTHSQISFLTHPRDVQRTAPSTELFSMSPLQCFFRCVVIATRETKIWGGSTPKGIIKNRSFWGGYGRLASEFFYQWMVSG
jgi:hypothetical protein